MTENSNQEKSSYRLWKLGFWIETGDEACHISKESAWSVELKNVHQIEILWPWSRLWSFFVMSGQNDHFASKWLKVVMWHIIRMPQSWIFRFNHFWYEKIVLGASSGKNQNFWKIFWWRHNPVKSPKLAKNIIIQLIEWNLYQKRQNQYAYAILKNSDFFDQNFSSQRLTQFPIFGGTKNVSIFGRRL